MGKTKNQNPKKYINNIRSLLYLIIQICPKGRTELIIGASRAKCRQESFAEVQKSVAPQKTSKNNEKHWI